MTVPPTLSQNALHEVALAYLAHRPASVAQLGRVLGRRVDGWARRAERAGAAEEDVASGCAAMRASAEQVLARLKASGLLDDAAFAKGRAERLTRAGKSRRAIAFDLAHKGVASETARAAVPQDADTELTAAVTFARKKRLGPFARESSKDDEPKAKQRALGALARAGYSYSTADRVLRMDRESAEAIVRENNPIGW